MECGWGWFPPPRRGVGKVGGGAWPIAMGPKLRQAFIGRRDVRRYGGVSAPSPSPAHSKKERPTWSSIDTNAWHRMRPPPLSNSAQHKTNSCVMRVAVSRNIPPLSITLKTRWRGGSQAFRPVLRDSCTISACHASRDLASRAASFMVTESCKAAEHPFAATQVRVRAGPSSGLGERCAIGADVIGEKLQLWSQSRSADTTGVIVGEITFAGKCRTLEQYPDLAEYMVYRFFG
eukprot:scaffold215201_cov36-Tisochrysis_lutea.AAC.3